MIHIERWFQAGRSDISSLVEKHRHGDDVLEPLLIELFRSGWPKAFTSDSEYEEFLGKAIQRLLVTETPLSDPESMEYQALLELDRVLEREGKESTDVNWYLGMLLNYIRYPGYKKWLRESYAKVYSTPRWKMQAYQMQPGQSFLMDPASPLNEIQSEFSLDMLPGEALLQYLIMHLNSYPNQALPKHAVDLLQRAVAWWDTNILARTEDDFVVGVGRPLHDSERTERFGDGISFAPEPSYYAARSTP